MARLLPQLAVQNLRATNFLVTTIYVHLAHVLLNLLPQSPTLGVPKHQAGGFILHVEQVQLFAQFAMVALFSFFKAVQVGGQVLFFGPGCAINTLQHFIVGIAAPIGTSHFHQLEVFQFAGIGHVWTTAQVNELAFAVQRNIFIAWNAGNNFGLVVFALVFEKLHGIIAHPFFASNYFIEPGQLGHFFLDRFQIFRGEGALVGKVVVKPVFDHRANGDLRRGEQFLHGIGK